MVLNIFCARFCVEQVNPLVRDAIYGGGYRASTIAAQLGAWRAFYSRYLPILNFSPRPPPPLLPFPLPGYLLTFASARPFSRLIVCGRVAG